VAHGYILHETLADVKKFHVAADKITKSSEDIPTKELLAIVKKGKAMVVWLPEMPQLEQVLALSIFRTYKIYKTAFFPHYRN
jgi:hypothetical protein